MNSQTNSEQSEELHGFDWPLAYEAETLLRRFIRSFLEHNEVATRLARDLRQRTGTDFYEWVDHFCLDTEHAEELQAVGLIQEAVETPTGTEVRYHPRAMMPRILLKRGALATADF
jgi:hypothetical protein